MFAALKGIMYTADGWQFVLPM